jgi:hypothetical protein
LIIASIGIGITVRIGIDVSVGGADRFGVIGTTHGTGAQQRQQ